MQLVYMNNLKNKELYTTSEIIAECSGVQHHTITKTLRKNIERFERYGKVGFNFQAMTSGQQSKIYILNEQQATLLITFLKNTERVADFKENLVKAFFELRKEVEAFKLQRALEKPQRKTLTDAIKEWKHCNRWSYKQITDLMLKKVTGMNAKQLKAHRHAKTTALDVLTAHELKEYAVLENAVIGLISLDKSYMDIAGILE